MLLALTRRDVCRQAIMEVLPAVPGWQRAEQRPTFVTSFAEAQRASAGRTACLVDLGSVIGSADDIMASNMDCYHLTHPDFQSNGNIRATSMSNNQFYIVNVPAL